MPAPLPAPTAFGVAYGGFSSALGAWLLCPLMYGIVGVSQTLIGLPATRIYEPLARITGFSFAYSLAVGVLGG